MVELVPIFLQVAQKDIVFFNFLMESYEGLAEVRTMNPQKGQLVVMALPDTEKDVRALIGDLSAQIQIREIPRPLDSHGDWLLGKIEN